MNKLEKGQKISVIIPCYNQGKYIDQAVESILNQSYKNFEIIIINDGSTDKDTNSLLKDYEKPNTKVYHTKNQGLASTRNYGFELSTGDFIQFLDADDFLDEKKFEEHIKEFKEDSSLGVSYTNYKYFYEETKEYSESQMQDKLGEDPFYDFVYKWQRGLSVPIHCGLFRKSIFESSPPFIKGFKAVEDWIMWVSIAKKKTKFKYLNKDFAFYRIQPNNMTRNKDFMLYWVSRAISYIEDNIIEEKDKEIFHSEQQKYLKSLIEVFYLAKFNLMIEECHRTINDKNTLLKDKDKIIEEKNTLLEEVSSVVSDKESLLREKDNLIKGYVDSRSYKIGRLLTAAPRFIGGYLIKKNNDRTN